MTESPLGVAMILFSALGSFGAAALSLLGVFVAAGVDDRRAGASGVSAVAVGIVGTLFVIGLAAAVVPWPIPLGFALLSAGLCARSAVALWRAPGGGPVANGTPRAAFATGAAFALVAAVAIVGFLKLG